MLGCPRSALGASLKGGMLCVAACPLHSMMTDPDAKALTLILDVQVKLEGAEVFVEGSGCARVVSVPFLSHAPIAMGGTEAPLSVIGDADASAARCVVAIMLYSSVL